MPPYIGSSINMKRNIDIDIMKGLAIMLVVIGHAIQANVPDIDKNTVFLYIYSFHMPLFMFLSGYLAFGRNIDLKRKFKQLAIPFFCWYVIGYLLRFVKGDVYIPPYDYIIQLVKSTDWGLWFLWTLFLNFCLLKLTQYFINEKANFGDLITLLTTSLLIQGFPVNIFGIGSVKWYFLFFIAGYLYARYKDSVLMVNYWKLLFLIMFPLLVFNWQRLGAPLYWDQVVNFLWSHHVPGYHYWYTMYIRLVPFTGIGFVYTLLPLLRKYLGWILSKLGMVTMEIYVIHQNLLFGIGSGNWRILSTVSIAILGSLVISTIMKKSKITSDLLFGGRT